MCPGPWPFPEQPWEEHLPLCRPSSCCLLRALGQLQGQKVQSGAPQYPPLATRHQPPLGNSTPASPQKSCSPSRCQCMDSSWRCQTAKGSLQPSEILGPHGGQGTVVSSVPTQCPRQEESQGLLPWEFPGPRSIHLTIPGCSQHPRGGSDVLVPAGRRASKRLLALPSQSPYWQPSWWPPSKVLTSQWTRKGLRTGEGAPC